MTPLFSTEPAGASPVTDICVPAERLRIMLLHPLALFRTSLARVLQAESGFELVFECASPQQGLIELERARPDVVVFDFTLWRELMSAFRNYHGKCLAIAEEIEVASCAQAISQGMWGVFLGTDSSARLIHAIRQVASGDVWIDRKMIQLLAERYPQQEELQLTGLSDREHAVLQGVLGGLTNRKIAGQIGASEATVKGTLQLLFSKTGVRTRSQLVKILLTVPTGVIGQPEEHVGTISRTIPPAPEPAAFSR